MNVQLNSQEISVLMVLDNRPDEELGMTQVSADLDPETRPNMLSVLNSLDTLAYHKLATKDASLGWKFRVTAVGRQWLVDRIRESMNVKAELETPAL